ncbi:MAG: type II secretion system minor pseudopilin GspK [Rhodospirillaceae bacterium]|nr:type II secretion system minor pseudopilin GspK [Rhodospirillaceae bacterium]
MARRCGCRRRHSRCRGYRVPTWSGGAHASSFRCRAIMTARVPTSRTSERGVVLLTTLLLVAVLAALIVAVMDDIRLAIKRTGNIRAHDQALWYARGAENLGRETIERGWKIHPSVSTLNDAWAMEGVRFPIDNGVIAGRIRDGGNCFNLNSVVQRDGRGRFIARLEGTAQLQALLAALDVNQSDAEALAAVLVDWIDSDSAASPGGAEDSEYMGRTPPYRTAGALLVDVTELRAMRGFSEKLYSALRPFVCALPTETPSLVNVNTLMAEQAVLLVMLSGSGLSISAATRVIAARPLTGFGTIDEFWALDDMAPFKPAAERPGVADVKTRYYILETEVTYDTAELTTAALVELNDAGKTQLHTRRIGAFE